MNPFKASRKDRLKNQEALKTSIYDILHGLSATDPSSASHTRNYIHSYQEIYSELLPLMNISTAFTSEAQAALANAKSTLLRRRSFRGIGPVWSSKNGIVEVPLTRNPNL